MEAGTDEPKDVTEEALLIQLEALGQLPSPSSSAMRLYALLQDEDAGLRELAAVVKWDVTLTVRLFRLANRPGVGMGRPVASIEEALMRLGLKSAVHLAAGLSVLDDAVSHAPREVEAYLERCWRSLAAAVISEWLCDRPGVPAGAAELFTCTLLARIGQLALLRFYPDAYADLLERLEDLTALDIAERENFAITHAAVGQALLKDWGFPEVLTEAVRLSSHPFEELQGAGRLHQMALIIRLAWDMAPALMRGRHPEVEEALRQALAHLGLENDFDLAPVVGRLHQNWRLWMDDQRAKTAKEHRGVSTHSNSPENPKSGESVPQRLRLLLVGSALTLQAPMLGEALAGLEIDVAPAPDLDTAAHLCLEGHADLLVVDGEALSFGSNLMPRIEVLVKGGPRGMILLFENLGEEEQVRFIESGVDAVLPAAIGMPLLVAQVVRVAERILLQKTLERERESHRKLLSQLVLTTRKLHQQTLTDALTGLANRRMADAFLKRHWAQAQRHQGGVCCLMIDLDNFKSINDNYGHDAGDHALKAFGSVLQDQVRDEDLAVRLGGDEFLVICAPSRRPEVEALQQRILAAIRQFKLETGPLHCTMGIAESDFTVMRAPEDLLREADRQLLQRKKQR